MSRGLRRCCPLCGGGGCFESFLTMRDRCPTCHYPLRREEGHWIGALGINTIVSFGLLVVTLATGVALTWSDRRGAPIFLACAAVALVVPLAFYGTSQTVWSAIDLAMRPPEPADDIDPTYLPPPRKKH